MRLHAPIVAAGMVLASQLASAGPSDYVYLPTVEYGEREIDFKSGRAKKGGEASASAASLGFGYGATEWWFTEIYVKYKRENGNGTRYDAIEWENKFQLTETGKYPVDLGFLVEIERPRDRTEGWEVTWGPLVQTDIGRVQLNANLLMQRSYRLETAAETELKYQYQAKYRWKREFEFGLQGFGELGKWNDWAPRDERLHRVGPAIFGKLPIGGRQAIRYNAAWLFAASQTAPDHTFRLQLEYEF